MFGILACRRPVESDTVYGSCPEPTFQDELVCDWLREHTEQAGGCGDECIPVACGQTTSDTACDEAIHEYDIVATTRALLDQAGDVCTSDNDLWREYTPDGCDSTPWVALVDCIVPECVD